MVSPGLSHLVITHCTGHQDTPDAALKLSPNLHNVCSGRSVARAYHRGPGVRLKRTLDMIDIYCLLCF